MADPKVFSYPKITVWGTLFYPYELIQYYIERKLSRVLSRRPQDIKNVLVVGAWHGDEVAEFLKNPLAEIYCFEPDPANFAALTRRYKNAIAAGRVHTYEAACSNAEGISVFYEADNAGNGSLLDITPDNVVKKVNEIRVKTVRLDNIPEFQNKQIDLLWIDVQGAELLVLQGAEKILKNIPLIFTETALIAGGYKQRSVLKDVDDYLARSGFMRVAQGFSEEAFLEGNILYAKTEVELGPETISSLYFTLRAKVLYRLFRKLVYKIVPVSIVEKTKKLLR